MDNNGTYIDANAMANEMFIKDILVNRSAVHNAGKFNEIMANIIKIEKVNISTGISYNIISKMLNRVRTKETIPMANKPNKCARTQGLNEFQKSKLSSMVVICCLLEI
ncbi:hypothetical protein DERP_000371 [Dermatophagoides pteronyssinus]|uniref:Uncharacterized protein n=1 Tax=Dermatophagoides pteronyssinus TaxID=6956 RepID=A0ABQ8J027_DERPT|nr:hypothetical protein DERP_000371 [Dermatophagoides pteronyssinus]